MKKPWYQIKAAKEKTAEIMIYDEIGESYWGEGITAKQFVKDLQALGVLDLITLRINSPGGNVFDAFAIYNALVRNPARVETEIDGMALSAASIVALAGEDVRMASNAMLMIHNPWGMVMGEAAEMRKAAEMLDKMRDNLADVYMTKTKQTVEQVQTWMDAETWFTAEDAAAAGFIDRITESYAIAARFDLSRYQRVPQAVLALRHARDHYHPQLLRLQQVAAQHRRRSA